MRVGWKGRGGGLCRRYASTRPFPCVTEWGKKNKTRRNAKRHKERSRFALPAQQTDGTDHHASISTCCVIMMDELNGSGQQMYGIISDLWDLCDSAHQCWPGGNRKI